MTPEQQLRGQQLATQAALELLGAANARVVELSVHLTLAQAEIAELKAMQPKVID